MTAQIFDNSLDAVAATPDIDGRHWYGMNGKVIVAESLSEARKALTPELKRLTQADINSAMKADLRLAHAEAKETE